MTDARAYLRAFFDLTESSYSSDGRREGVCVLGYSTDGIVWPLSLELPVGLHGLAALLSVNIACITAIDELHPQAKPLPRSVIDFPCTCRTNV